MEPLRTCVGCRGPAPKRELLRIVRTPDGAVRVDPTGAVSGRGAYVHLAPECAAAALGKGGIARGLRTGLAPEELGRLTDEIEQQMGVS